MGLPLNCNERSGQPTPCFSKPALALAVARDRDDILFEINDGASLRYAVVHLTWSGKTEVSANFPWTEFFDSLTQWIEWMKAYHEEYTYGEEGSNPL
jgi:hypothetical protein